MSDLFKKYDVPAPRYTSYPTVPYWNDSPSSEEWITAVKDVFSKENASWSLYLHIPYCESLCTFCGCNTVITKDHGVESPYVDRILSEWNRYLEKVPAIRERGLRQLHLGGGTPTFLAPSELERLLTPILSAVRRDEKDFEGSVEVDPRRTTREHLEVLYRLGFRRVSLGVQDFDPEVQRVVNRVQPLEITKSLTEVAREIGYDSVNFDLIYGLPKQDAEKFIKTAELTVQLRPDRIALYSFALVPWIKKVQRIFKDEDVPTGTAKREIYEVARKILLDAGYVEIGMDHFALKTDSLARSIGKGELHRNFMGYTDHRTDALLGIGLSAISETPTCFHQNEKVLPVYERLLSEGGIPSLRGHKLTLSDQAHREQILALMTKGSTEFRDPAERADVLEFLAEPIRDGLAVAEGNTLRITEAGKPFLRNICMAFDQRLREKAPTTRTFSQAV
jgi:oxygen-independent coproporphyrinogen III oxidase